MEAFRRFFSYAEIKTKITSVFPFLMALAFLYATGETIDARRSAVLFLGMLLFDMTATTINNFFDSRKNGKTLPYSRRCAGAITLFLLSMSVFFGLWLFYLTDILVLAAGAICFAFGIAYSFGPAPISHTPYGELVSGFIYGLIIPAITTYINIPHGGILRYTMTGDILTVWLNFSNTFAVILLSVMPFCLTANIMLANNICDVERDVAVGRYTLAFFLKERALNLFAALYYMAFLSAILLVLFKYVSPISLLILVLIIPVQKNIRLFNKKQQKVETFILSIKNYILMMTGHITLIVAGGFLSM